MGMVTRGMGTPTTACNYPATSAWAWLVLRVELLHDFAARCPTALCSNCVSLEIKSCALVFLGGPHLLVVLIIDHSWITLGQCQSICTGKKLQPPRSSSATPVYSLAELVCVRQAGDYQTPQTAPNRHQLMSAGNAPKLKVLHSIHSFLAAA